ncbi:MAG: hypothetical protein K1Y02_12475 [Candidatus Hydrogenedentes bacterium]|nr:hypothetical protein [Candidatus Hydrogenedentota bacterium]
MNTSMCTVCRSALNGTPSYAVTVKTGDANPQAHEYCGTCAARYLDTVDMFGMTVPLIDSVRCLPAA